MLDELPEEQSRTLVYRFTEGLPLAEIAEIMDCTVSTVKSRLKYGKQKIEEQVYALEKRGIKLYSTSIPTLLLCLRWLMADRGGLSAEQAGRLLAQINSAIGAAASAAAGAAQSVGTAAKAAAAKNHRQYAWHQDRGGRCCSGYCGRRRGRSAAHHAEGQPAGVGRADRTGSRARDGARAHR
mgnify:CR=1 FL=1